ncbi:odorant receptor Or1-like [Diabrotica undecimpunctata]|uniref:odorant receptor Or1-like n=1 Tax=Diabrotica undecimpunctata TaxID=50387 RepID=UPI003B64212C
MRYKTVYKMYSFICTLCLVLFLLSQFIYMYLNIDDMDEIMAVFYLAGPFIVNICKMLAVYRKFDEIKILMKKLNNTVFQPKCKQHLNIALNLKKFHKRFFYVCLYLGLQTYLLFYLCFFLNEDMVIPTQGWFPFDYTRSPYFEIVYIFQNAVVLFNTVNIVNIDTFCVGLMMQIGMQCDYLCTTLNNLKLFRVINGNLTQVDKQDVVKEDDASFSRLMLENLIICIQHHRDFKRIANEVESLQRVGVFILFCGGGVIICSGLFQLSTASIGSMKSIMLVSYIISMLTDQFVYCGFGNEVIEKSSNIFRCAYNTPWIECDIKFKKILLQFMTLTKDPIRIRVGGILVVSNAVFVSVSKSSYSIFTLLKKVQE